MSAVGAVKQPTDVGYAGSGFVQGDVFRFAFGTQGERHGQPGGFMGGDEFAERQGGEDVAVVDE